MIESFDTSLLISINEEVSFGVVLDMNGLESAIARPWTSSYGQEMFETPWKKAGAIFHALASTQYFQDGNKRTAWVASELLLNELGQELKDLPDINYETFALSTAVLPDWDEEKAAEWFEMNSVTIADKVDFSVLGIESQVDHPAAGLWSGVGINAVGFIVADFPAEHQLDSITRIEWRLEDVGSAPKLEFAVRPFGEDEEPVFRIKAIREGNEGVVVAKSGHPHHRGAMPVIYQYGLLLEFLKPGRAVIEVLCQGTVLRALPVVIDAPEIVPNSMHVKY